MHRARSNVFNLIQSSRLNNRLCFTTVNNINGLSATVARTSSQLEPQNLNGIRQTLTSNLKEAMKSKDTLASTTIRSVLAEIYGADKSPSGRVSDATVISIIRKAVTRRRDSAAQFQSAGRQDLADIENQESQLLSKFLPTLLSSDEIDLILRKIILETDVKDSDGKRTIGMIMKKFYANVDHSVVDGQLVKERVVAFLAR